MKGEVLGVMNGLKRELRNDDLEIGGEGERRILESRIGRSMLSET
jgi:hypothetical protein